MYLKLVCRVKVVCRWLWIYARDAREASQNVCSDDWLEYCWTRKYNAKMQSEYFSTNAKASCTVYTRKKTCDECRSYGRHKFIGSVGFHSLELCLFGWWRHGALKRAVSALPTRSVRCFLATPTQQSAGNTYSGMLNCSTQTLTRRTHIHYSDAINTALHICAKW